MAGLVLLLAAGCARPPAPATDGGGVGAGGPGHVGASGPAVDPHALDNWRDFPVTAKPRPIVLASSAILNPGYRTGEAKAAAMTSGYALPASLPGLPESSTVVALPDGAARLPLVDARTAFALLLRLDVQPSPTGTPLPITRIALGTATFATDRGALTLPAWQFTARDGLGPIAVPAVAASAFWHLERQPSGGPQPATVSADGRTLVVPVPDGAGGCPGDPVGPPTAVVVTSPGAVAVGSKPDLSTVVPGDPASDCARPLILRFVPITVTLDEPLGNRVLLDATGNTIAVVPS